MLIMSKENPKSREDYIQLLKGELPVLRAKARISQEIAAEKIGVTRQTYSAIETGKRQMSWTMFLALFAYFQNNEQTRLMVEQIFDLSSGTSTIIDIPPDK